MGTCDDHKVSVMRVDPGHLSDDLPNNIAGAMGAANPNTIVSDLDRQDVLAGVVGARALTLAALRTRLTLMQLICFRLGEQYEADFSASSFGDITRGVADNTRLDFVC